VLVVGLGCERFTPNEGRAYRKAVCRHGLRAKTRILRPF
jgi:hypothetical protein